VAAATAVFLVAACVLAVRRDPWPRQVAAIGIAALFSFLCFKQGFVRQGLGSGWGYFAMMLGAGLAISDRLRQRTGGTASRRWPALALVAPLVVLVAAALPNPSLWRALQPDGHLTFLREDVEALTEAGVRASRISSARASMRADYGLDRRTLRLLGDRTVHIDPLEIGAAWAYGLNWKPLPVFQDYVAYTPELDALNAAALRAPDAPQAILRENMAAAGWVELATEGRVPGWDPPLAKLAMLCHYRAVRTTWRWQLLERVPDRCGPGRRIGSAQAVTGERIAIPPSPGPDEIVIARIDGVGVEGWERARAFLYRAYPRTVTLSGGVTRRLTPDTAGAGLIVRAPRFADFPAPFSLAPDSAELVFDVPGTGERALKVEFLVQKVRPEAAGEIALRGSKRRSRQPIAGT
jgi:hypothetical protein